MEAAVLPPGAIIGATHSLATPKPTRRKPETLVVRPSGLSPEADNPFKFDVARGVEYRIVWETMIKSKQLDLWSGLFPGMELPAPKAITGETRIIPSHSFLGRIYEVDPFTPVGHAELISAMGHDFQTKFEEDVEFPQLPEGMREALKAWEDGKDYLLLRPSLGADSWGLSPRLVKWESTVRSDLALLTIPQIMACLMVTKLRECKGCESVFIDAPFYTPLDGGGETPSIQVFGKKRKMEWGGSNVFIPCSGSGLAFLDE